MTVERNNPSLGSGRGLLFQSTAARLEEVGRLLTSVAGRERAHAGSMVAPWLTAQYQVLWAVRGGFYTLQDHIVGETESGGGAVVPSLETLEEAYTVLCAVVADVRRVSEHVGDGWVAVDSVAVPAVQATASVWRGRATTQVELAEALCEKG